MYPAGVRGTRSVQRHSACTLQNAYASVKRWPTAPAGEDTGNASSLCAAFYIRPVWSPAGPCAPGTYSRQQLLRTRLDVVGTRRQDANFARESAHGPRPAFRCENVPPTNLGAARAPPAPACGRASKRFRCTPVGAARPGGSCSRVGAEADTLAEYNVWARRLLHAVSRLGPRIVCIRSEATTSAAVCASSATSAAA